MEQRTNLDIFKTEGTFYLEFQNDENLDGDI